MATRSAIGIKHGDRVKAVYCHWDGYLDHNGAILNEFYNSTVTVNNLIALGDISSLGATIGEKIEFGTRWTDEQYVVCGTTHAAPQCTFYSRDRGEDAPFRSFDNEEAFVEEVIGHVVPVNQYYVIRRYPDMRDQLDMLWHELNTSGSISADGAWFNTIKDIKDQHPKP